MMRLALFFLPSASPTCVPLGIATLAQFIRDNEPSSTVDLYDLNLETWSDLASREIEFSECRDFMQGRGEDFFNKEMYSRHFSTFRKMAARIEELTADARVYLESGRMSESLGAIFEKYSSLVRNTPDIAGFSLMYPSQVAMSLAFAHFFREIARKNLCIVIGGATASALQAPEILTACPFVDAVHSGEGESALLDLVRGTPFDRIAGMSYRVAGKNKVPQGVDLQTRENLSLICPIHDPLSERNNFRQGNIAVRPKPDTLSPAKLSLPLFSDFEPGRYFNPYPVFPLIFSRGCKWRKCRFCSHNFSYSGYRRHEINRYVDYLEKLTQDHHARHFYFADQYIDTSDALALAEGIIARRLDLSFHLMGRPSSDFSLEAAEKISAAGCRWISWGIETGSQRLLDLCNKGATVDDIRHSVTNAHRAGISNLAMMIYGLPTSTDKDLYSTFDLLDDLNDALGDMTASCFQLFDRTIFASRARDFGLRVTGREVLVTVNGQPIHSLRLHFEELSSDGSYRRPRGPIEVGLWKKRRAMISRSSILEDLCCEHCLIYARHIHENSDPEFSPGPDSQGPGNHPFLVPA